ncbi:HECT-type E3 ubiquitin transferase [Trifolium repens]|nr:HECT-type E3 ubiquitin transferase [Trifolium repens]
MITWMQKFNGAFDIQENGIDVKNVDYEARLIFRGKQLQWEQTIAQCGIQRDINLQLVGRIRIIWGGFLEAAEFSLASYEDQNFKGLVLVQDLFPFVPELVDSLLMNLESSIDSPSLACPLLTDIGDFTAFLVPVRTGIEQHQALRGCVPYHKAR